MQMLVACINVPRGRTSLNNLTWAQLSCRDLEGDKFKCHVMDCYSILCCLHAMRVLLMMCFISVPLSMPLHRYPIQDYHLEEQGIYTGERWVACVQLQVPPSTTVRIYVVYNQMGWKLAVTKNVESVKHRVLNHGVRCYVIFIASIPSIYRYSLATVPQHIVTNWDVAPTHFFPCHPILSEL